MSLIFDRFPSRDKAESFVAVIQKEFNLAGQIFDDSDSAQEHDPFPWVLDPPVVHIDRPDIKMDDIDEEIAHNIAIEEAVEDRVTDFGGTFAGT